MDKQNTIRGRTIRASGEVSVTKSNTDMERTGAVNLFCPMCGGSITINLLVRNGACPDCGGTVKLFAKYSGSGGGG